MCFGGGGGSSPPPQIVNTTVAPPAPPPKTPAATPSVNPAKSGETQNSSNPNAVGYGSLIIPRTAFAPVSVDVPKG